MGDIHNFSNRYSSKLPAILNCNFINFDNYANEIEFYKKNWSYLPFDVSDSSIVGAGRGLFATRNLSKY